MADKKEKKDSPAIATRKHRAGVVGGKEGTTIDIDPRSRSIAKQLKSRNIDPGSVATAASAEERKISGSRVGLSRFEDKKSDKKDKEKSDKKEHAEVPSFLDHCNVKLDEFNEEITDAEIEELLQELMLEEGGENMVKMILRMFMTLMGRAPEAAIQVHTIMRGLIARKSSTKSLAMDDPSARQTGAMALRGSLGQGPRSLRQFASAGMNPEE